MTHQNHLKALKDCGGRAKAREIAEKLDKPMRHVSMTIRYELYPQYIDKEIGEENRTIIYVLNGNGKRLVEGRQ